MKVAIDAHALGRGQAGYESYLRHLTQALPAASPGDDFLIYRHLSVSRLRRLVFELPRAVYRDRPDVLHVQYAGPLLPLPSGCSLVATIHDVSFVDVPEFFSLADRTLLRLGVGRTIRQARRVITVSEFSKARLMKAYGIPEDKIQVIYNAAGSEFRPALHPGDRPNPPYIVMVADLSVRKNQVNLIRAFSAFARRYPHHLMLAGRDSATSGPIREAARLSEAYNRIHFLGYVPDQELPRLYQQADLCVYPSLYEGFGLPVVEAMACGTPVVTSRASALLEVAGGAALLANPRDPADLCQAMEAAIRDRERWRRAGLLRAARFSWSDAARRTVEAYRASCATVSSRVGTSAQTYRNLPSSAPEQEPCESTRSKVDLGVS